MLQSVVSVRPFVFILPSKQTTDLWPWFLPVCWSWPVKVKVKIVGQGQGLGRMATRSVWRRSSIEGSLFSSYTNRRRLRRARRGHRLVALSVLLLLLCLQWVGCCIRPVLQHQRAVQCSGDQVLVPSTYRHVGPPGRCVSAEASLQIAAAPSYPAQRRAGVIVCDCRAAAAASLRYEFTDLV